jgi:type VI secretion system protein ImpH
MAPPSRRESVGLSEQLLNEPYRFDFFQAVRLLERALGAETEDEEVADRYPVGMDWPPDREAVRFRAQSGLSFSPSPITQIRQSQPDGRNDESPSRVDMWVSFLGLTGPGGVLPQHYTALLLRRVREKDFALRDFLDLFNHRLVSLFYRAWEKYRLPMVYERACFEEEEADPVTQALFALVGLGTARQRGRQDVEDETFLFYAGHFARQPRSAAALEGMLSDHFELPVTVEQFQGQWLYLEESDRSYLPGRLSGQGRNHCLGVDAVIGERVWDVQSRFRVRMGPLDLEQFRRFMPRGSDLQRLCQLTRTYAGPELDFDVQLVLRPNSVPACRLGVDGPDRPSLGWNVWLQSRDPTVEVSDAVFSGG